jgi:hypothetical protein
VSGIYLCLVFYQTAFKEIYQQQKDKCLQCLVFYQTAFKEIYHQ